MLKENDIQENVLKKIHGGNVSMRSHTYFIFRTIFIGAIALILLAGSFFLLSFVFFSVQTSGTRYLLEFSEQGLAAFVMLFPWLASLIALVLLIVLEVLLRNFKFGYQSPLLRIFLWILIIGAVGSTLLGLTPLHSFLLSVADNDQLPLIGSLYEQVHDSHQAQGVYRGDITSITESSFVISYNDADRDSDEGTWNIIPPAGFNLNQLIVGQKVYVAGHLKNNIIYAYGIHLVKDNE